jgi:hypothetical protein
MRSEVLLSMNDAELIQFADDALGITIPPDTKRTKILTKIVNAAVIARDSCG